MAGDMHPGTLPALPPAIPHAPEYLLDPSRPFVATEITVEEAVRWLRLIIESTGAIIIALGIAISVLAFVRSFRRRHDRNSAAEGYNGVRLTLSRYLALSLEFQLGADILSTAIAPSWEEIGKLGAVAFIRTGLNYFLGREMREEIERAELRRQTRDDGSLDDGSLDVGSLDAPGDAGALVEQGRAAP